MEVTRETHPIVNLSQHQVIEETPCVRIPNRDRLVQLHRLDVRARVVDVPDKRRSAHVARCGVDVRRAEALAGEVAVRRYDQLGTHKKGKCGGKRRT